MLSLSFSKSSANLVDETESRNLEKDLMSPTFVPHQPCTSDSVSYDHMQENDAAAVGLGARLPEQSPAADENVLLGGMHASAGCDATLQESTTEPLSKRTEIHAVMVQLQSPREQYPNAPPHFIDAEMLHDDGARDHSLKPSHGGLDTHDAVASIVCSSSDALPTNASEPGHLPESVTPEDTTKILQPHSSKADIDFLQHENVEKVNQVLDDVNANIQQVGKDHVDEDLTLQTAGALHSVSCNYAFQEGQSVTNHLPGNATKHTTVFEGQHGDKSHIEFSSADKVNEAQPDNADILGKSKIHCGLNVHDSALHDKISEAGSCEHNTGTCRTDAQKNSCSTSAANITQDGIATSTTKASTRSNLGDVSVGIPHVSSTYDNPHGVAAAAALLSMTHSLPFLAKDQEINDSSEGLSQEDLRIKCGKAGQLLQCSDCLVAAHDSCFGSTVTFQESELFYCPVCFYTKATEAYQKARKTYFESRKNLATFLGTAQVVEQHDELLTGALPRASNREGQSNVSDSLKRKHIHQHEVTNFAHRDEEPDQHRKQKICVTVKDHPAEIVTENASTVQNSKIGTMNQQSVLKGNSSNQVQEAERQQQAENKQDGNGSSSHETRRSSQNRCRPPTNQEVETEKDDGPTKSNQSDDSDEIEATLSTVSGKRSSPPRRKLKHRKSRLQGKERLVSSKSRKNIAQLDQHVSSSRKRNNAPQKRYSNPVTPTGRRSKLSWTKEEERTLKEAMEKFAPRDDGPIPWILEYGRDSFHRTRLASDLRVDSPCI